MATKTLKPVKTAAKTTGKKKEKPRKTLKPLSSAKVVLTVDQNLSKLAASRIPMNFVREHNGSWDHEMWLAFLESLKKKGYEPIDPDRVGLILEEAKAKFLAER